MAPRREPWSWSLPDLGRGSGQERRSRWLRGGVSPGWLMRGRGIKRGAERLPRPCPDREPAGRRRQLNPVPFLGRESQGIGALDQGDRCLAMVLSALSAVTGSTERLQILWRGAPPAALRKNMIDDEPVLPTTATAPEAVTLPDFPAK